MFGYIIEHLYSLQTWRMEAAQAHSRTLNWVLHQEPYDGSDAQDSVDREEEMIRRRDVEMESMEEEMEMDCAFNTKEETRASLREIHLVDPGTGNA